MNRRKLLSLLGMSPVVLAGKASLAQTETAKPAKRSAATPATGPEKFTTVNPKGTPPAIQLIPMAPRLNSLDGKTIYLVDTGFHGSDLLLEQIQIWFKTNMPGVTTVFRRKAGPYMQDDPALWKEIKEKGNAAIMATGH
jgi:hypothetical protein